MRSELVFTNMTCNQNCTYCNQRSASDAPAFVAVEAVRQRIDSVLVSGAVELVLTGGEPGLRRDLAALVSYAKTHGTKRVVLETNATTLDVARAAKLHDAGLDLARVNACDDIVTRDPGGLERSFAGVRALIEAGIDVEITAAVVRSTRAFLPLLPALIRERGGPQVSGIAVSVPVESPDTTELLSYEDAAESLLALDAAARPVGLPVRLRPPAIPPCVVPLGPRTAQLFALTPGGAVRAGYSHVDACTTCSVNDRCPGIAEAYVNRFGLPVMRPILADHTRRRLSLVGTVQEQVRREFVQINQFRGPDGSEIEEHIVRVNFHCNQSCAFCFVSTHLPAAGDQAVRDAIAAAGSRGAKVVLSGGEPTLNPKLAEYVALAKQGTRHAVNLQTNATRLNDPSLLTALIDAGLTEAFVSLHGCTADASDDVTGSPGTFVQTLEGLDALAVSPISVVVNFVICQRNIAELTGVVRLLASRWPRFSLNVSFVAPSTDVVPRDATMIPRYSDVAPVLTEAIDAARALGVPIVGFESMCGVPLCLVPQGHQAYFAMTDANADLAGGEFVRAEACHRCALSAKCFGVRRGYAELHGVSELHAISRDDAGH